MEERGAELPVGRDAVFPADTPLPNGSLGLAVVELPGRDALPGAAGREFCACRVWPEAERPSRWIDWCTCAACRSKDCGAAAARLPKKCCAPPRVVDGLAARPLADKLARVGVTGRFPVMAWAPPSISRLTGVAATRPWPKRPAGTLENALRMRSLFIAMRTLEKRSPPCRGPHPPRKPLKRSMPTTPKRPR